MENNNNDYNNNNSTNNTSNNANNSNANNYPNNGNANNNVNNATNNANNATNNANNATNNANNATNNANNASNNANNASNNANNANNAYNNPNNGNNNNNYDNNRRVNDAVTTHDVINEKQVKNAEPKKIVYFILGILETLFAFRLVLKILGANPSSLFVSAIYNITHVLLFPFEAIFRSASTTGIETKAVLEPSTIIGMIVYALLALGIVKLIYLNKNSKNI